MRLHQAMLFVVDLEGMAAFYKDVIGFTPIDETRSADWAEFDTGGARLALHAIPKDIGVTASPTPRETQSCKLLLTVDDLAATRERLAAAGVTILERPWGGWDIADPEGNVLGVVGRP